MRESTESRRRITSTRLAVLIVALASLAGTAVASASDSAWFSLVGGATLVSQGPGQTLVIEKPACPGSTTLTIGYNFTNAQQYLGVPTMAGWGFSMNAAAGVTYGGEDFTNSVAAGYDNSFPSANGATLLSVATSGPLTGVGATPVFTFTVTIQKSSTGPLKTELFGELATQATTIPTAWFGSFGPNANQYGIAGYAGGPFGGNNKNLPVITINNVGDCPPPCADPCNPECPNYDPCLASCGGNPCDPACGGDPCSPACTATPCSVECCGDCLDDGDPCTIDLCVGQCACVHLPPFDPIAEMAAFARHGIRVSCVGGGRGTGGPPMCDPNFLVDAWVTEENCTSQQEFDTQPVPADFFAPGSEPFSGVINFKGESLEIGGLGKADTLIERSADPFTRCDPPSSNEVTVDIEIVALNLVSCEPITVVISGQDTLWDVEMGLSDCPPPSGTLTAVKEHCNGGTYESVLHVQPKLTFTRVNDPLSVVELDAGCVNPPLPFLVFTATPQPWVHDIFLREAPVGINHALAFHPGITALSQACGDFDLNNQTDDADFSIFLSAFGHSVGDAAYEAGPDFDCDQTVTLVDYQQWLCCFRCFVGDPLAPPPMPGPTSVT